MERIVEPEWLDHLPSHDARARRARADLCRVNWLMGNARHLSRALAPFRGKTIADLGSGDGRFLASVACRMRKRDVAATLVDRGGAIHGNALDKLRGLHWEVALAAEDVYAFLSRPGPRFDAIVTNLFLHHFDNSALRRLLELAARRTSFFIACEPRRSRLALQASRLLGALGCSDVTRHDAAVSVRAGFRGHELSALWPERGQWRLEERPARPFGHLFVALRHAL
jgi:hypothetical protein